MKKKDETCVVLDLRKSSFNNNRKKCIHHRVDSTEEIYEGRRVVCSVIYCTHKENDGDCEKFLCPLLAENNLSPAT
jgi:regulator of replication initiation timing